MRKTNILKKLLLLSSFVLISAFGFSQYLTESFEGTWVGTPATPTGWSIIHTTATGGSSGTDPMYWKQTSWSGTAWSPSVHGAPTTPTGAFDGSSVAWFDDYNAKSTQKDMLVTPSIDLSASTNPLIEFYWALNASSSVVTKLRGSIDGGTTWEDIQTLTKPGVAWTKNMIQIPASYKVANAKLGFEVTGTYGSYDVFLDKVVVRETVIPSAPITLSFTDVTSSAMTVNWIDNSTNEASFRVYYSPSAIGPFLQYGTDITSTSIAGTGDAYSSVLTGLIPSTTYYFRVVALTDFESGYLTGSQITNAPGNILSTTTGGPWSDPNTWVGGNIPTAGDNVTIVDGATVSLDIAGVCNNLTVGQGTSGILAMGAFALNVNNLAIETGATVNVTAGTAATLNINGNAVNNGTLDLYNTSTIYGKIIFTGYANASFTLNTGSISDFDSGTARGVYVNKGTNATSILDFVYNGGTVNVAGSGTPTNGFFYVSNGTLKISGNETLATPLFSIAAYTIPSTGCLWLNNPNFTVKGQAGAATLAGKLQITDGIFMVGTTNNSFAFSTGATILIEGGIVSVTSRFGVGSATNAINYTQTGGTVYVNTGTANETSTLAAFDAGTSASTSFTMSGGTIVVCRTLGTNTVVRGPAATATVSITGGTLQIGTDAVTTPVIAATAANQTFRFQGLLPQTVVNSTNNPNVLQTGNVSIFGDLTINGTGTFTSAWTLTMRGNSVSNPGNIVNNGTMTFNGTAVGHLYFGSSFGNQSLTNNGTITGNTFPIVSVNNTYTNGTVTLPDVSIKDGATYSGRLNLIAGKLVCANLTLGGGAGTGGFNCYMSGGSLQNLPTFDFGTGIVTYVYDGTAPQVTGIELPASLTNAANTNVLTINNATGVTLSAPLSVDKLILTSGNLTTSNSNLLTILNTTTTAITQTNGYVNGPIAITLPASLTTGSTYVLPIGKANSNKLELVNPITNAGGSVLVRGEVFDVNCGGTSAQFSSFTNKYWKTEIVTGSANFENTTIRLTETVGTLDPLTGIGSSNTLTGDYTLVSLDAPVGNTILSNVVSTLNYFVLGIKSIPTINVNPTSLSFDYCAPNQTSAEQTYVISGSNLTPATGDLTVTPPAGFEVSLTSGTGFSASAITIPYSGGSLANTTIFVVFKPTTPSTPYSGNITNSGGGITGTKDVAVTGTTISPNKDIITFNFLAADNTAAGLTSDITGTIGTNTVTLVVPGSVDITEIIPTITVSDYATISPLSGVAQDFTTAKTYTVTAENGTTKVYTVTVTKVFDIPYFEGFESGHTDQAAISNYWTQASVTGTYSWSANTTKIDYNRTPRTGSWNAYLRYNNTRWMFTPGINLEAGKTYTFEMYARQDGSAASDCDVTVKFGENANISSMTNTIVAQTSVINGDYQLLTNSFTVATTGIYYIGILGYISNIPWYLSVDDINVKEALANDASVVSFENAALAQGNSITPNVVVKNEGTADITSMDVKLDITGPNSYTYTQTVTVTNIVSGATAVPAFASITLPAIGQYTATVTTQLVGDQFSGNNELSRIYNVLNPSKIAYGYTIYNEASLPTKAPIAYELDAPQNLYPIANHSSDAFAARGGEWIDGVWYSFDRNTSTSVNRFLTINPLTGEKTVLNATGISYAPSDITYDYSTNTLFGIVSFTGGTFGFYSINLTDGILTQIGTSSAGAPLTLACNLDGEIYSIFTDGGLYSIDKTTGVATLVGSTGITQINYVQSMAFDHRNGDILYWNQQGDGIAGGLYTVNTTTGEVTLVGNLEGLAEIVSFAIPYTPIVSAELDRYEETVHTYNQADVDITITWNSATEITELIVFEGTEDEEILVEGEDYVVNGNVLTIFFDDSKDGDNFLFDAPLTIKFDVGEDAIFIFHLWERTYTVNYSVVGTNGTLTANSDGEPISSGSEVPEGYPITFEANPATGFKVKEWRLNGSVVSGNVSNTFEIPALTVASTVTVEFEVIPVGTYVVNFSVVNGNGSLAALVGSTPITSGSAVNQGSNITFNATPNANYEVKEWKLNGSVVPGNTTNTYTLSNLNQNSTVTVEFKLILGINSVDSKTVIYPNPSNGLFTIEASSNISKLSVMDITGRIVYTSTENANTTQINLANCGKGIYFVEMIIDGQIVKSKVVIE